MFVWCHNHVLGIQYISAFIAEKKHLKIFRYILLFIGVERTSCAKFYLWFRENNCLPIFSDFSLFALPKFILLFLFFALMKGFLRACLPLYPSDFRRLLVVLSLTESALPTFVPKLLYRNKLKFKELRIYCQYWQHYLTFRALSLRER